jgi:hypothetical protein
MIGGFMPIEENYEGNVDEVAQDTSRAAEIAEEDLAREVEDQPGESRDDKETDLSGERYEYEFPDGEKIQGTFEEVTAAVAAREVEAKVAEALAKATPAAPEKPPTEPAKGEGGADIAPVDWSKTGDLLATRLGMDPEDMEPAQRQMLGEIGPMFNDALHRTILTSKPIAGLIQYYMGVVLDERESGAQKESSFKEFVGAEVTDAEVQDFMKANPWCETKKEAVLSIQLANAKKSGTEQKAGSEKEMEAAKKKATSDAEAKVLATKKAAGTLRVLGGSKGARPGATSKQVLKGDDRVEAAMAALTQSRAKS